MHGWMGVGCQKKNYNNTGDGSSRWVGVMGGVLSAHELLECATRLLVVVRRTAEGYFASINQSSAAIRYKNMPVFLSTLVSPT